MTATMHPTRQATQKQFDFIKRLLAERQLDAELQNWVNVAREAATKGHLSSSRASQLIDALLAAPKAQAEQSSAEEPQAGIYRMPFPGNGLYRVYLGQQSGRMLVSQIVGSSSDELGGTTNVRYEYLGAAARKLPAEAERMTIEEVGALGKTWDTCLICGRRLDVPESVDRGIGPVCAERY